VTDAQGGRGRTSPLRPVRESARLLLRLVTRRDLSTRPERASQTREPGAAQ